MGKRGGARTIYYYWESKTLILFSHIYAKNEQEDLHPKEKKLLNKMLQEFKESYHAKK
jgi:hypothetical protein